MPKGNEAATLLRVSVSPITGMAASHDSKVSSGVLPQGFASCEGTAGENTVCYLLFLLPYFLLLSKVLS